MGAFGNIHALRHTEDALGTDALRTGFGWSGIAVLLCKQVAAVVYHTDSVGVAGQERGHLCSVLQGTAQPTLLSGTHIYVFLLGQADLPYLSYGPFCPGLPVVALMLFQYRPPDVLTVVSAFTPISLSWFNSQGDSTLCLKYEASVCKHNGILHGS